MDLGTLSTRKSHEFIANWLSDPIFYRRDLTFHERKECAVDEIYQNIMLDSITQQTFSADGPPIGTRRVVVTKHHFYECYKRWVKRTSPGGGGGRKERTFWIQLKALGIAPERTRMPRSKIKRTSCVRLTQAVVKRAFEKIYKSACPKDLDEWITEDPEAFDAAKQDLENPGYIAPHTW